MRFSLVVYFSSAEVTLYKCMDINGAHSLLHCARFVTAVVVTEGALVLNDLGKGFRGA